MTSKISEFQHSLLRWYRKHKRDLPWRRTKDPYKIWLSEIMLQQTQVATVIDYYHRFLDRFPDVETLARGEEGEVLTLWSGLGYYSRARNLHHAAQIILKDHGGRFPSDPGQIASLPGIGRYTQGAVASIAFGQALPVVDGNVVRVYARFFALKGNPKSPTFQKQIWKIAESNLNDGSPGDFNQALMELGARVCTPQKPLCLLCPIQKSCKGLKEGAESFPEKKKGPPIQNLKRVAVLIEEKGRILLLLSPKHRWMKGLWQLPSLFAENGSAPPALARAIMKELGFKLNKLKPLPPHVHAITHHRITVLPFHVSPVPRLFLEGSSEHRESSEQKKWFSKAQIAQIALPSADRKILSSWGDLF